MNKKIAIVTAAAVLVVAAALVVYRFIVSAPPAETSAPAPAAAAAVVPVQAETLVEQDRAIKKAEAALAADQYSPRAEDAYLKLASLYAQRKDLVRARDYYRKAAEKFPASSKMPKVQQAIEDLNVRILFSPVATDDSLVYTVAKGDNLTRIAKKYGTTVELLMKSNGLTSAALRIGQKLKVTKLKFSIVVDKSQNILTLKADGNVFKTYRVATGRDNITPVGSFTITNKIVDPPWYPPNGKMIPSGDPKNVLGSRWMGISKPTFGIHGTIDPSSIGKSVTDGCVRLTNAEVEELFDIVPQGTEVVIVD